MKSIREKREKELERIIRDIYRLKKKQENNQMIIVYDYLHMKVRQMQNKGLLWDIEIPNIKREKM
tara:strand:+ start:166 stop:360 length:195 start_codon:yes stop_codon:yes gene_type:complete